MAISHTFECQVCFENKEEVKPRSIHNSQICQDCIVDQILPLFKSALRFEAQYPPSWGPEKIDVDDYADDLGIDFVKRYRNREIEYKCRDRVYCKHKIHSTTGPEAYDQIEKGPPLHLSSEQIIEAKDQNKYVVRCGAFVSERTQAPDSKAPCTACTGYTCTTCESPLAVADTEHACITDNAKDGADPLAGQTRGRDYQLCPGCNTAVFLGTGCNHVHCRACNSQFCYICGISAKHDSGHWDKGMPCPRWNQPLTDNAHFDNPDEADEEDDAPAVRELDIRIRRHIRRGGTPDAAWINEIAEIMRERGDILDEDIVQEMIMDNQAMLDRPGRLERVRDNFIRMHAIRIEIETWEQHDHESRAFDAQNLNDCATDIDCNIDFIENGHVHFEEDGQLEGPGREEFVDRHHSIDDDITQYEQVFARGEIPTLNALMEEYLGMLPGRTNPNVQ